MKKIKYTTDTFVYKANNIHNNKYDYSLVEYSGSTIPIKIICKIHGEFMQTPNVHLCGSGCKKCAYELLQKNNVMPIEQFIKRSHEKHNDKYDYSLVEYDNVFTIIRIICPTHGVFEQIANSHLRGAGCIQCFNELKRGKSQILSLVGFVESSNKKHNNKYDYSLVEYKNSNVKIKIICPIHGEFIQSPGKHLFGQGCKKCGREIIESSRRGNTADFIVKAKKIHGDKYDYSLVDYKNNKIKIKIICPIHGCIEQRPLRHLNGKGCIKCGGSEKLTTEIFTKRANEIHECKYDYSLSEYANYYGKVKIICPAHGSFEQGAGSHLAGIGCPKCFESKGEKEISNYLIQKRIIFETQKTFEGCVFKRKLRFDFYLPEHNTCIEYDGEQHYKSIPHYGGYEKFDLIQKKDSIKTQFCKLKKINLLRIRFDEDIIDRLSLI